MPCLVPFGCSALRAAAGTTPLDCSTFATAFGLAADVMGRASQDRSVPFDAVDLELLGVDIQGDAVLAGTSNQCPGNNNLAAERTQRLLD